MSKKNVLIVYCHPSRNSFTEVVKDSFVRGLEEAGHNYQISDLYAEKFNPVMTEDEYLREGFYHLEAPVAEDVIAEQEKINTKDTQI